MYMEVTMAIASTMQRKHSHNANSSHSCFFPHSDDDHLAVIGLNDTGEIRECSRACEEIFGYRPNELAGRHVSALLPQLSDTELVLEDRVHPRLAFLCRCAMPFEARHRDGRRFNSELFINRLDRHNIVVLVRRLEQAAA